jgi:hypothetical protein
LKLARDTPGATVGLRRPVDALDAGKALLSSTLDRLRRKR